MLLDEAHVRLGLDRGVAADIMAFEQARLREETKRRSDAVEDRIVALRQRKADLALGALGADGDAVDLAGIEVDDFEFLFGRNEDRLAT
jgi:hypothetical protein